MFFRKILQHPLSIYVLKPSPSVSLFNTCKLKFSCFRFLLKTSEVIKVDYKVGSIFFLELYYKTAQKVSNEKPLKLSSNY